MIFRSQNKRSNHKITNIITDFQDLFRKHVIQLHRQFVLYRNQCHNLSKCKDKITLDAIFETKCEAITDIIVRSEQRMQ